MKNKFPILGAVFAPFLCLHVSAAVLDFSDDFSGGALDSAWDTDNKLGGSYDAENSQYTLTSDNGVNNSTLRRVTGDENSSYVHSVTIKLENFIGSDSDFNFSSLGYDSHVTLVMNSFGNIRIQHTDVTTEDGYGWYGTTISNQGYDFENGQEVTFNQAYDLDANTLTYSYAINGGDEEILYTGNGGQRGERYYDPTANDGAGGVVSSEVDFEDRRFGDTITGVSWQNPKYGSSVHLNQWGGSPDAAIVHVTDWSLTTVAAVPEPSSTMLIGLSGVAMLLRRRR